MTPSLQEPPARKPGSEAGGPLLFWASGAVIAWGAVKLLPEDVIAWGCASALFGPLAFFLVMFLGGILLYGLRSRK